MAREAVLGGAEAPEWVLREEPGDGGGAVLMDPMRAPRGHDHGAAGGGGEQGLVVLRAVGIAGAEHRLRIGGAKAKDVGHEKTIKARALGKRTDAGERGVEFLLVGRARVEPDPHDQLLAKERIDPMQQRVAVPPVGREVTIVFH